jgi:hypothetical protein
MAERDELGRVQTVFDPPDPTNTAQRLRAARRRRRLWTGGLWALAGVVAVLGAVTVAVSLARSPAPTPGATCSSSPTTTTTSAPPGSLAPASGSSPPTISSLSPSTGGPGQRVVITGTGFLSANGQIVASFGGATAPTSCPTSTSCTATAPAQPGTSSQVQVTIRTDTGTSNGEWFTYQ